MATYDVDFLSGVSHYYYMLAMEGNGKAWSVEDVALLPPSLVTGKATAANISPEKEFYLGQMDWRKGFQTLLFDEDEDIGTFYDSDDCDTRYEGKVIQGPKKTEETIPTTMPKHIINEGLEDWSGGDPDDWDLVGGAVVCTQSSSHHGGSSSADLEVGDLKQSVELWDEDKGKEFTFKAWCKQTGDPGTAQISIYDGVGTTSSAKITEGDWTEITATRTLDGAATELTILFTVSIGHLFCDDASLSRANTMGSGTEPILRKSVQFGTDRYFAADQYLLKLETDGSLVVIREFAASITDLCVFGTNLFIAQGHDDAYWYTADGVTFTESTLANNGAEFMSNVGGAQFWISEGDNTMRDSDDPVNGGTAFSSQYTVGVSAYVITGLVDHLDYVYVRKQDNVYVLSEGDVTELVPEFSSEVNTSIDYGLLYWQGKIYIAGGVNSLYEYDAGTVTDISPAMYAAGDDTYDGRMETLCADGKWLYAVLRSSLSTTFCVLAGQWDSDGDWVWHPVVRPIVAIGHRGTSAWIFNGDAKELFIGTNGGRLYSQPCSQNYADVLTESGYKFDASGTFTTPWFTTEFPTEEKYFKQVKVTSICIKDGATDTAIACSYELEDSADWVSLGNCSTSGLGGGGAYPNEKTNTFAIGASGKRIRFKFVLSTNDDDYSAVLYGIGGGFVVEGRLEITNKQLIKATLWLMDESMRNRAGTVVTQTMSTMLSSLRTLKAAQGTVTLTGPDDTAYTVWFLSDGYRERLVYDDSGRNENWHVDVQLLGSRN